MVLEMKRALEDLKSGDRQGYRKIYDATYEEVFCRSFLILQKEDQAAEFMKGFFTELFGMLDEADSGVNQERWLWQKYYQRMRKQYHKLLADQQKSAPSSGGARTLAEIPAALPLLHRIMLVMYYKDDFAAGEISAIFGLAEDKIQAELQKLEKVLPSLTKGQPESVSGYLGSWKVLLLGASRQLLSTGSYTWVNQLYTEAAAAAGISVEPAVKKDETFEYFIADADLTPVKPKKKPAPVPVEEPDEDDEDEEGYDEEEDDVSYDGDEYDDEEDYEDDRYDWDLEDDGRKMVILGIVLALIIVVVLSFGAFKLFGGGEDETDPVQTEQDAENEGDAELIIRGDGPDEEEEEEPVEEPVEEPEEEPVEEPEEAEPQTVTMKVSASSSRVRSEPNTDSSVVASVTNGEKVEVLSDTSEEWVQIRCIEQNQEEGYMMSQYLTAAE